MRNESGVLDRSTFLRVLGAFGFVSAGPTQAALAQARTVYLATYSHVDPDWLWPYQEGEQQAHSTFRSVLGILDEFPQLRFSMTSAVHYKWVRESDPASGSGLPSRVVSGSPWAAGGSKPIRTFPRANR